MRNLSVKLPKSTISDVSDQIKNTNDILRYNLKILRHSVELNQSDLSEKAWMDINRIGDIEGGRLPAKLEDIVKIVKYFNITFDDLLYSKIEILIPSKKNT